MEAPRYLCSQLVKLSWQEGAAIVNLEEIQTGGAVLESEVEVPVGLSAEIRCGNVFLAGKITRADRHELGVRIEMEFSPLTPWSIERFRPEHLLDVSRIEDDPTESP
jgi:hypothetical protein